MKIALEGFEGTGFNMVPGSEAVKGTTLDFEGLTGFYPILPDFTGFNGVLATIYSGTDTFEIENSKIADPSGKSP